MYKLCVVLIFDEYVKPLDICTSALFDMTESKSPG